MGYYVRTTQSQVLIRKERFEEAYRALCALNQRDELKGGGCSDQNGISHGDPRPEGMDYHPARWFSWMDPNYPAKLKTLEEILDALGFFIDKDADGSIVGLHYDNKTGDEGTFLEALAPFGSGFIRWSGEDGETWTTTFEGDDEVSPWAGRQIHDHETPRYRRWLSEVDNAPDDVVRTRLKWVLDSLYGVGDGTEESPRDVDPGKDWEGELTYAIGEDLEYFAPNPQDEEFEQAAVQNEASDIDAGELATLTRCGDERAQAMREGDEESR